MVDEHVSEVRRLLQEVGRLDLLALEVPHSNVQADSGELGAARVEEMTGHCAAREEAEWGIFNTAKRRCGMASQYFYPDGREQSMGKG
ncbi:hypothetical protein NDU88_005019 [Pleurodeles waltl]|uniref:Uncharacterized protein n=1 Tax=Pleurodeles waltl TaxID=8319 RepID=A0AAV7QED3_PLEWA|nr:hypothetical protein NDU88_005019 [Pleurodeles waltl]